MSVNKVILIGHTGDDVKMHYFDGGNSIGRVPLATNSSYTNKQTGEKVTNTEWHNIVLRNKTAEAAEKYAPKGSRLYIEGELRTRKWQTEDGTDRYTTEVHANRMEFLTTKAEGSGSAPAPPADDLKPEEADDDLPF